MSKRERSDLGRPLVAVGEPLKHRNVSGLYKQKESNRIGHPVDGSVNIANRQPSRECRNCDCIRTRFELREEANPSVLAPCGAQNLGLLLQLLEGWVGALEEFFDSRCLERAEIHGASVPRRPC